MDAFELKMYKEEQRLPISERKAINDYCNKIQWHSEKGDLIAAHPIHPELEIICLHFQNDSRNFQVRISKQKADRMQRYIGGVLEYIELEKT